MIILLGGASHTGKTLLSQKLLEQYQFPCTSMDHLKMGFIRTGRTDLTVEDDNEMCDFLWPFTAEMVKTAIENNQNMVLEGCYIPRNWKESFSEDYLKEIRAVFIVMSEKYLRNHFDDLRNYASVIERRLDDELNLEHLIKDNAAFKNDCIANGTPFIKIDDTYNLGEILAQIDAIIGG